MSAGLGFAGSHEGDVGRTHGAQLFQLLSLQVEAWGRGFPELLAPSTTVPSPALHLAPLTPVPWLPSPRDITGSSSRSSLNRWVASNIILCQMTYACHLEHRSGSGASLGKGIGTTVQVAGKV